MGAVEAVLLFTDIEGSTRLWDVDPTLMSVALRQHDAILAECIAANDGQIVKGAGDGVFAVFNAPLEAVHAALAIQVAVAATPWPTREPIRLRVGLHSGVCEARGGDYFGEAVNRAARLHAIAHGGQILLSGVVADSVAGALPDGAWLTDLGEHRLKDLRRAERVYQLCTPELRAQFPPLRSLSNPRLLHNLPQLVSTIVGRERDLAAVRTLMDTAHTVTLVGSGGVGKTTLALQVAAEIVDRFGDGAWWVDLTPVEDPALLPARVAAAVEVPIVPAGTACEGLAEGLADRQLLIVLDNCEHVIDAAATLAVTLTQRCGGVRILATSREPLRIRGEYVYRVPSLDTEAAARVFCDRAREHGALIPQDQLPLVDSVCRKLDGIPLAIELSAARLRFLGLADVEAGLARRFDLLRGGDRNALPRQQTLRSLIDWSYDLLSTEERLVFEAVSVFPASFELSAAASVAKATGIGEEDAVELVAALVDKSLIVAEPNGVSLRYRLLETIREYGRGKLTARGLDGAVRSAHLAHFAALAEQLQPATRDARQPQALARLLLEHDNMRAALTACLAAGDAETGLRLAVALDRFWMFRAMQEGAQWLRDLLSIRGAPQPPVALSQLSLMVLAQDPAAGLDIARQALVEARKQTDPGVVAWALRVVGYGLDLAGDAEGSAAALEDAVQMARRSGDAHVLGVCLLAAAGWHNGRADAAPTTVDAPGRERVGPGGVFETVLAEARSWADATGDTMLRVAVMGTLGYHLLTRGDLAGARHELTSALALARELGSEIMLGNALVNNGLAAYLAGDRDEAGALFREALEPTIARHSALETANATLGLALVIENQDGEVSALLHGAADARCAAVGYQREDVDERASAASKERLRAQLGEHRLTGLLNDGAALSLDSIIELAARAGVPRPPERSEAGRQRVQNLGHGASFELG